jgi:hypothetical protein
MNNLKVTLIGILFVCSVHAGWFSNSKVGNLENIKEKEASGGYFSGPTEENVRNCIKESFEEISNLLKIVLISFQLELQELLQNTRKSVNGFTKMILGDLDIIGYSGNSNVFAEARSLLMNWWILSKW